MSVFQSENVTLSHIVATSGGSGPELWTFEHDPLVNVRQ